MPRPANSVIPHNSMSGACERASQAFITEVAMVWPPTVQRVRLDRSKLSNPGSASIIVYIVGTPSNIVARCSSIKPRAVLGVEALHQHDGPAAHERAVDNDVAIHVWGGQGGDDDVARGTYVHCRGESTVQIHRKMRLHCSLRVARRARRVPDG